MEVFVDDCASYRLMTDLAKLLCSAATFNVSTAVGSDWRHT